MTTILHIDSSILGGYSVSRTLTADIVARQQALHPGARVIRRDLVVDAALHLSDAHMAVFQGGEVGSAVLGQDLAVGGAYIDDLFAADIIVIGAPMYNFSFRRSSRAGSTASASPAAPSNMAPMVPRDW